MAEPNPRALDASMLLLGESTSEIQTTIVARGLTRRWKDERDGT